MGTMSFTGRLPTRQGPCCWAISAAASQTAAGSRGWPEWRRRKSASCCRKTSKSDEENSSGVVIATQPSPAATTASRTLAEGTRCTRGRDPDPAPDRHGVDTHAGCEVFGREAGLMELPDEVLDLGPGPVASPRITGWNAYSPLTTLARAAAYTMELCERLHWCAILRGLGIHPQRGICHLALWRWRDMRTRRDEPAAPSSPSPTPLLRDLPA
jgi:hypothetical protein